MPVPSGQLPALFVSRDDIGGEFKVGLSWIQIATDGVSARDVP